MTESEFLDLAQSTLERIELAFDRLFELDVVDVECKRNGNVLEIEFVDNGSKIIVNSQAPLQEMWIAAPGC
jgi:CyaY protein